VLNFYLDSPTSICRRKNGKKWKKQICERKYNNKNSMQGEKSLEAKLRKYELKNWKCVTAVA
jgi:hypothetical protein